MGRAGCDGGMYQVSAQSVIPLRNGRSAPALGPIENVLKMTLIATSDANASKIVKSRPILTKFELELLQGSVHVRAKFRLATSKGSGVIVAQIRRFAEPRSRPPTPTLPKSSYVVRFQRNFTWRYSKHRPTCVQNFVFLR